MIIRPYVFIMAKILILYGTDSGQTRKVADRIAGVVRGKGHEVQMVQGIKAPADFSPAGFDAAIIGTSVHLDVHQISVKKLVKEHREAFSRMPTAYFCVCLTAYSQKPKDVKQVQKYIDDFTGYTGLRPVKTAAFAGDLKYPDYNYFKRFTARLLARKIGADTDTKQYFEYTDWAAVTRFADEFVDPMPIGMQVLVNRPIIELSKGGNNGEN